MPNQVIATGFTTVWSSDGYFEVFGVSPRQHTDGQPDDPETLVVRAVCHWLIEALPKRANEELLKSLADLFTFYRAPRLPELALARVHPEPRRLAIAAPTMRAPISIPDEG